MSRCSLSCDGSPTSTVTCIQSLRNADRYYHMPVSLMTFHEIFGTMRPDDIPCILAAEREKEYYPNPENLEQKAVSLIGRTVYDLLIKGYTEKQWGRAAT